MLARNNAGETAGEGIFGDQAVQVFKNVQASLEPVGRNMRSILKMNVFMAPMGNIPAYREIKSRYIPEDSFPASTLILCSGLADPISNRS